MFRIKIVEIGANFASEDEKEKYAHIFGYMSDRYANSAFATGRKRWLDKAIVSGRLSVKFHSRNLNYKAGALLNLSHNLRRRYEQSGKSKYLDKAIYSGHQALEFIYLTPNDAHTGSEIAVYFNGLANKLSLHYELTLGTADLDRSIHLAQSALNFSRSGQTQLKAVAPTTAQDAIESHVHSDGHINSDAEPTGSIFISGHASHQDNSVEIDISSGDPLYLYNLGVKLFLLYLRTRESAILNQAIDAVEKSITLPLGDGASHLAKRKSTLGDCLCERYRISGDRLDIDKARLSTMEGIELIGSSPPFDILFIATSAANALLGVYAESNDLDDLKRAAIVCRIGLKLSPPNHIQRPRCLNILGMAQEQLYNGEKHPQYIDDACDSFLEAWNKKNASLLHRACSVTNLLPLLAERRRFGQGVKIAKETVELLQNVADMYKPRGDRQYLLSLFAPVAAQICAIHLEIENLELAIQHLEIARTVILGHLMDHRNVARTLRDFSSFALMLDDHGNELNIDTFNEMKLHEPYDPGPPFREDDYRAQILTQLTHGWRNQKGEEILKELRDSHKKKSPSDLRERLRPQVKIQEIQTYVGDGTIVIINSTRHRSDAILISSALTEKIDLPREFEAEATSRLARKWDGTRPGRGKGNKNLGELLAWLWTSCVLPVLEQIRSSKASQERQRIWWLGTGSASALPFHAAGVYGSNLEENAYHQTLSSYISSIRALANSRKHVEGRDLGSSRIMIATMPTTPEMADLAGVTEEAHAIKDVISDRFLLPPLELQYPTSKTILQNLRSCNFVHFACHGVADPHDPSNSGTIFQREVSGKLKQDILTVRDISKIDLWNNSVAYLSACSTAENKATFLSEEAINLVTGFQVAGFRHVVGCLWPSMDKVSTLVAKEFYTLLFRNSAHGWKESDVVANALREAVMKSWKTSLRQPLSWAPFVHYGP